MARLVAITVALLALLATPAAAQSPTLPMDKARAIAAKTAQKVKQDLREQGARKAKVPGCWRQTSRKVACYFAVIGYDSDLGRWKCMLRVTVRLRAHKAQNGKRIKLRYGRAVCG
jgi:hypothetical protein